MFNYTKTSLINSGTDLDGTWKFKGFAENSLKAGSPRQFVVKKDVTIYSDLLKSAEKQAGSVGVKGSFVVNSDAAPFLATINTAGIYRIALYIRLSGSQNSYYSNDMVFKGKPLYFEYEVTAAEAIAGLTNAQLVAKVKKAIDATQDVYDFKYVTYVASGAAGSEILTITLTDEYQVLDKCNLELYYPYNAATEKGGKFEIVGAITHTDGVQGYGTYDHLIKDYRIPTLEARRFGAISQDELPIPGALYTSYIFTVTSDRGILGGSAVGQEVKSTTTHVFWVLNSLVSGPSGFDTQLTNAGIVTT